MRWLQQNRGFTLIEVVIVLAISALLLAGAIAGRGVLFQNSSFATAMDDAQNTMRQIQNEANQAISPGAGESAEVVFGRLVELSTSFAPPSTIQTWTLIGTEDNTGNVVALAACNEVDGTFQDGVSYNPTGSDPNDLALIFTRNNDVSGTTGQLFVAPSGFTPGVGGVLSGNTVSGEPPVDCSPGAATPPPSTLNLSNPCPVGTYDRLTGCIIPAPNAPTDLKATDAEDATADSNAASPGNAITTASPTINLTVTLPQAQAGAVVTLYSNGVAQPDVTFDCAGGTGPTCTASYTLPSYNTFSLTAEWSYDGSPSSTATAPISVTYSIPTSCSTSAGYVCGLTGFYYSPFSPQPLITTIIDKQVGCDLDGLGCNDAGDGPSRPSDPSSYSDFTTTLKQRTDSLTSVESSTVDWSGQIYLSSGSQQVCIDSNSPAKLTIGSYTPVVGTGGTTPVCGTYIGASAGTWANITIAYTDTTTDTPYVRLVSPGGTMSQTETCAVSQFFAPTVCDTSPTQSDINICEEDGNTEAYFDNPPPDLPGEEDISTQYYVCRVNTTTVPGYMDIAGSRLRTTAVPPPNTRTVGLASPSTLSTNVALATAPALSYHQLVQTITAQAKTIVPPTPVAWVNTAAVLRSIARAVGPGDAEAAGVAACDNNILNPVNYLNATCTDFTNGGSAYQIPISIPGNNPSATTQQGNLIINFDSNTINWSSGP